MLLVLKYVVPKGYSGITIYPFVVLKKECQKADGVFINHEKIHLLQQKEMCVIFFYVWYVIEFLIKLLKCWSWNTAYRTISFEQEAYANEANLGYIKKRPKWAVFNFI